MNAPSRIIRISVIGTSIAYALALHAAGLQLDGSTKKALAYLPTLAGLFVIAFDLYLWRLPPIHRFTGRPLLGGTWFCLITPGKGSAIPEGGNWGPIPSAVMIEQTFWSISIVTMTGESRSVSTSANIRFANGSTKTQYKLAYTYANEPGQQSQPRSQPHVGASELAVTGRHPTRVSGNYWTGRLTAGDMQLTYLNSRTDYPNAEAVLRDVPEDMYPRV